MSIVKTMPTLLLGSVLLCAQWNYAMAISVNQSTKAAVVVSAEPVNINSAALDVLQQVKGLGETRAKAIINYRDKHGPFATVQSLTAVPGIGGKLVDNIKGEITAK